MKSTAETRKVAHFALGELLGRGGMGAVYRAEDEQLRRTVAVKLLPTSVIADPESRARFLREARAAAAVVHGNIATVFEIGESGDDVFIVMEYVPGRNLREVMRDGRLGVVRAIRIAIEIVRGLCAAHDAGVVHRDLKPENVMVGNDDDIKILDFGLARVESARSNPLGNEQTDLCFTAEGRVFGTPGYMSPEQGVGGYVDRRTDVFALGVMLYEMVSGTRPFDDSSSMATIIAVSRDPHAPLRAHVPSVPAAVERIVDCCLAKAPEDRYSDTRALLADLRAQAALVTADDEVPTTRSDSAPTIRRSAKSWPSRPHAGGAATNSYVEAMQTWRSSSVTLARSLLERAIEADPALAAAHLRLALLLSAPQAVGELSPSPSRAREHFKRAEHYRESLEPAELALLEAVRPSFDAAVNLAELARREAEAAARFPDDRELVYWLAVTELARENGARVEQLCDQILRLDPDFGPALALRIIVALDLRGDIAAARRAAADGAARLPSAGHCSSHLAEIHAISGQAAELERIARQWISADPEHPVAYWYLAQALDMDDAPVESVEEALRQSGARHAPGERDEVMLSDKRALAASHGDFAAAIELSLVLERTVYEKRPDTLARVENMLTRAELLVESGKQSEAVDLIEALDKRRAAWAPHPTPIAGGLLYDPALRTASILYRAGRVTAERLAKTRDKWLAKQRAALPQIAGSSGYLWIYGYAQHVETRAEADEALAVLPEHLPFAPRVAIDVHLQFLIGRVFALAGRDDEAAAALAIPAHSCSRVTLPLDVIGAAYFLGIVEQRRGHAAEAREALSLVVDRWGGDAGGDAGNAASSVTAALARAALT